MKAAIVPGAGQAPVYGDFSAPAPADGENRIRVSAAGLSPLVRGRASGVHYSSSGRFPVVVGVDGVGRLDDGSRVYFFLPREPYGAMAEQTVVPLARCVMLPDALDDVTAAAIANPGMSSWAAYTERARLKAGETVLVNGATGASGRLAVQIAKHLGAKKVIASGRNAEALKCVAALGADVTIELVADDAAMESAFRGQFAGGVDVVSTICGAGAPNAFCSPPPGPERHRLRSGSSRSAPSAGRTSACRAPRCARRRWC